MRTIEFRRTVDDLVALTLFARERLRLGQRQRPVTLALGLLGFAAVGAWHYRQEPRPVVLAVYAAGALLWGVGQLWLQPRIARACVRSGVRRVFRDQASTTHRLTITDDGVREQGSDGETFVPWSAVPAVARTETHLFVLTGPASGQVVPLDAFASRADADAFYDELRKRKGLAP